MINNYLFKGTVNVIPRGPSPKKLPVRFTINHLNCAKMMIIQFMPQFQIFLSLHLCNLMHISDISNLLIPTSLQPDAHLWYFKLRLLDITDFIVWNFKGLRHRVTKILWLKKIEFVAQLSTSLKQFFKAS